MEANKSRPVTIVVEGNIGSGKSTFLNQVQIKSKLICEHIYLANVEYTDKKIESKILEPIVIRLLHKFTATTPAL
jgi:signal recognition particle receptor subunit beta